MSTAKATVSRRRVEPPRPWPLDKKGRPKRRVSVGGKNNGSIYWRPDGKLEIGYHDSTGKQRWKAVEGGITAARTARDEISSAKGKGQRVMPNPRLRFGEVADRWLAEQVADLSPHTQECYRNSVETHLRPRWGARPLDSLDVDAAAKLVRELRTAGKAEWTIQSVIVAANRVFRFARRRMGWHGSSPIADLDQSERPKVSDSPERRIYQGDELAQVLAASREQWRTLFRLANVTGARESELLALWWENLDLSDMDAATIRFTHQVDRKGRRVPLKTEESKAILPLPRAAAVMMLEHKARSRYTGPRAFVFATKTGRPLGQRSVLRALHRAQELARDADGRPTFPKLFEHDERGHLVVNAKDAYVLHRIPRRELPALPDFHALRHTAAMDCDDAEEARDLLRHRNSNVTRAIYRAHFSDKRRERLRAKMEARHGSAMEARDGNSAHRTASDEGADLANVLQIGHVRQ